MGNQFEIDKKGIKSMQRFFKEAPRTFGIVSAGVLNTIAFKARSEQMKQIEKDNTIRNPGLLRAALKVKTANPRHRLDQQESRAGSILKKRHDGWEAIQEGSRTRGTVFEDAGRTGEKHQGRAKAVAKANTKATKRSDVRVKNTGSRASAFIMAIKADKTLRRKPFFVQRKRKGLSKGIYQLRGGRVAGKGKNKTLKGAKLVLLSIPGATYKPKKTNWNEKAVLRAVNQQSLKKIWTDQIRRQLNIAGKKFK